MANLMSIVRFSCVLALPVSTSSLGKETLSNYFVQQASVKQSKTVAPVWHPRCFVSDINSVRCYNTNLDITAFLLCATSFLSTMCDFSTFLQETAVSKWNQDTYRDFPLDPVRENTVRFQVRGALFSAVAPTPFRSSVELAAVAPAALALLDLSPEEAHQEAFVELVSGNAVVPGVPTLAHRYGGHQFGYWAEQLGDGRAHLLAEYTNR